MRKGTNAAHMHLSLYRQVSRMGENSLASSKCCSPVREFFFSGGSCRASVSRLGCPFLFFDVLLALAQGVTGKLRHLHFALALMDQQNVPFLLSFYTQKEDEVLYCANICNGESPSSTTDFLVQESDRDDKVAIFPSNKFIPTPFKP